jgi:hypothetical protein
MSSKYAATSQRSLAAITRKGSTFTLGTTTGTPIYDPATDTWSGSTSALATGRAVQIANDLQQVVALGLVAEKTVTLLAAAKSLTVEPKKGMVLTWSDGVSYSIDDVQSVAPDGTPILYTIVAST